MCGVRRSAVAKLRHTFQSMIGDSSEKQEALLAGILNVPKEKVNDMHLPKWAASQIIDSVASNEHTPESDKAQAGPYGVYDEKTRRTLYF